MTTHQLSLIRYPTSEDIKNQRTNNASGRGELSLGHDHDHYVCIVADANSDRWYKGRLEWFAPRDSHTTTLAT